MTRLPLWQLAVALLAAILLAGLGVSPLAAFVVLLAWGATLLVTGRRAEQEAPRPRTEAAVSPAQLMTLVDHFAGPVLMLDNGRIAGANAAARAALGRHIVGQDVRVALRHPEAVAMLAEPGVASVTVRGLTSPRSIWQVTRAPIDARFALVEFADRTAEADVSRAHTDFVANASHELRTPLASIIGYIETLAEPGAQVDPATAERFHGIVLREAKRLQTLVEDLMSLSRIEAEKHDAPQGLVDLGQLAASVVRGSADPAASERLRLEGEPGPGEALVVRGDRQQLDQLVRNLVDNAMKYGDKDKPVTLALAVEGRNALVTVRDEGEGIAPEHLPHLTRRFYRTDPGRSRAIGGTGLGLAIVKHIVERHRGQFDIASEVGVGTIVSVRLPLVRERVSAS